MKFGIDPRNDVKYAKFQVAAFQMGLLKRSRHVKGYDLDPVEIGAVYRLLMDSTEIQPVTSSMERQFFQMAVFGSSAILRTLC